MDQIDQKKSEMMTANASEAGAQDLVKITRRNFLKIVGAGSVAGVVGCADKEKETIVPYVKHQEHTITGKSVWYNTTCTECSAGCGIQVRTREGRAVKIEGNPNHPVNHGGVCAVGHSALQNLYDPDRVRQPLVKKNGRFEPIGWRDAYTMLLERVTDRSKKTAFLHGDKGFSLNRLIGEWCNELGVEEVRYDTIGAGAEYRAAELVYGTDGLPGYRFEKADVIVNFGADFLESWVSPCEFARGWAQGRKKEIPTRFFHIEPRLSLTGANADSWIKVTPGHEVDVALAILKGLLDRQKGSDLSDEVRSGLRRMVRGVTLADAVAKSGVSEAKILLMTEYLADASGSIVLSGGPAAQTTNGLSLAVVTNFINLVLGNVGNTVVLSEQRRKPASLAAMTKLVTRLQAKEISTVIVDGSNPIFNLPGTLQFDEALRYATFIVSFASHIDETTALAHLILPAHTPLEGWGDHQNVTGVFGLRQPVMTPVFDTRELGDMLLVTAQAVKADSLGGHKDFLSYLKNSWKSVQTEVSAAGGFDRFWLEAVERGGYFAGRSEGERVRVSVNQGAFGIPFAAASFDAGKGFHEELVLFPFPSVRSFDGNAANRPWLHEVPDPVSQIVWDGWAEIHPETAKKHGIAQGDMLSVRNYYGELNLPAYLTEHVHPSIVAVPRGHGHTGFGRYAQGVGANVMKLLPAVQIAGTEDFAFVSAGVQVLRGPGRSNAVNVQGSDSQLGRELARTAVLGLAGASATEGRAENGHPENGHHEEGHSENGHGAAHGHAEDPHHHEPKQMYKQREHPLYRWGMAVDLAACTGCSACVVACYAENNIAVVGKDACSKGRELSWLRIERYYDGSAEELQVSFLPMMCQHCGNAPCEPVCPVYATYHNDEGMNVMVYNRCVGTRYCSNNCSYKVRRFNWYEYTLPEPLNWQLNPDVSPRNSGIMEKCTFCIQRISDGKDNAKDLGRPVRDGEIQPACVQSCPTQALAFGNLNDPESKVSKLAKSKRAYKILDHHINTQPAISYLEDRKYKI